MSRGPYILDPFQTITAFHFGGEEESPRYLAGYISLGCNFKAIANDNRVCAQPYFFTDKGVENIPWLTIEDDEWINGVYGTDPEARAPGFPPDVVPDEMAAGVPYTSSYLTGVRFRYVPPGSVSLSAAYGEPAVWSGAISAEVVGVEEEIEERTIAAFQYVGWSPDVVDFATPEIPIESGWTSQGAALQYMRQEFTSPNTGGSGVTVPPSIFASGEFTLGSTVEIGFRALEFTGGVACYTPSVSSYRGPASNLAPYGAVLDTRYSGPAAGGVLGSETYSFDISRLYVEEGAKRWNGVGYWISPSFGICVVLFEDPEWTSEE
jgi:hypothetical protein